MDRVTDDPHPRRAPRWMALALAPLALAALLAACGEDDVDDADPDPDVDDADADELVAELERVMEERDAAEGRVDRLEDERDDLEAERERLVDETDQLRDEIDRLAEAADEADEDDEDDAATGEPLVDLDAGRLDLDADERAALLATLGGDPADDASAEQARVTAQLHRLIDADADDAAPTAWREPADLDVDDVAGETALNPQAAARDLIDAHVDGHVGGSQEASTVRAWRTDDDQFEAAALVWGLDDEVRAGADVRIALSGAQQGFAIDDVEVRDWCREGVEDDRCAEAP